MPHPPHELRPFSQPEGFCLDCTYKKLVCAELALTAHDGPAIWPAAPIPEHTPPNPITNLPS